MEHADLVVSRYIIRTYRNAKATVGGDASYVSMEHPYINITYIGLTYNMLKQKALNFFLWVRLLSYLCQRYRLYCNIAGVKDQTFLSVDLEVTWQVTINYFL